jgi:hypothetical protein
MPMIIRLQYEDRQPCITRGKAGMGMGRLFGRCSFKSGECLGCILQYN